jgi:hypothetical protein
VTAANGNPVLFVVIFASERNEIPENWVTCIAIQKTPVMEEINNNLSSHPINPILEKEITFHLDLLVPF